MKNINSTLKILALFVVLNSVLVLNTNTVFADSVLCTSISSTLKFGAKNKSEITKLQDFLISQGYMNESTGYFGRVTENALKLFQKKEGIPALGIVGPLTKTKITAITCVPVVQKEPVVTPIVSNQIPKVPIVVNVENNLPYTSTTFNDWVGVWGRVSTTTEKTLKLRAGQSTNGAQAVLMNSGNWNNYKTTFNIFVGQGTVILISRYVDENNFLACNFTGKYIEITQRINGVSSVVAYTSLSDAPYNLYFSNDLNFSMRVDGKSAGCSMLGSEDNVTFTDVNDRLLKGGIAIQIWGVSSDVANIEVKAVKSVSL